MDPEFVLMNETLDVDEFLCDVSMHLRRRDLRTLLGYIGLSRKEVDSLLYDCKAKTGTERGLLSNTGTVVEGSSLVNFMEQRRKAMQTWWEYAANTKQRNTPAQQRVKVVESSTCALPQIPEHRDVIDGDVIQKDYLELEHQKFPPISPIHLRTHVDHLLKTSEVVKAGTPTIVTDTSQSDDVTYRPTNQESRTTVVQGKTADVSIKSSAGRNSAAGQQPETPRSAGPVVQVPVAEMTDVVGIPHQPNVMSVDAPHEGALTVDRGQQTDLVGCDVSPDQVAILGSSITLEELLRKLWKSLQACGLNKVVEILQQRWLIRVDVNQGRADMFPKMTWGTPLPPQTPFTYPPYKKIGHLAVMGSTMSIEAKTLGYPPTEVTPRTARVGDNGSIVTSRSLPVEGATSSRFLPSALRERLKTRSAKSRGGITSVSLDGAPVTSFPTRDSWKLRTDTVRRKGAAISIHVTIDDVTLPPQPSMTWGSSLHVTGQQIRERVARVFFSHVVNDSRVLCKTIDRIEKIRGLVVEHALKRIGGGGNGIEITNSQLVFQCRCLHPETVEQVWLLYQSGQLRENIQAGLVTKRARHACAVDFLHLRAHITEEEYRRALGLLRRKPMPNTKSGRFYVTTGTGGAIGGTGGMVQAQNRALMSVTRYLKLPTPAENNVQAPPPNPPATSLAANETPTVAKSSPLKNKPRPSGNLLHKVLGKELEVLRQRLRMCEDEWCEFAANQMAAMLRCASNVMRRRIVGATTRTQLTPRCTNVSLLRSLYKAIKATQTPKNPSPRAPPTIPSNPQQVTHIGIALYPSDVTFSNTDLVTSVDDDDDVIKARKQEERDFVHSYCHFTELIAELGACRATLQERIVARLTTNPTVAPSKHLYLAKDVYNLMERWRHMLARDFNFGQDEVVQRFSKRILSDETVIATFASDLLDQFPGIVALLPTMFHISEQILTKVKDLIPKSEAPSSNRIYTSVTKSQGGSTHNAKHLSIWLSA